MRFNGSRLTGEMMVSWEEEGTGAAEMDAAAGKREKMMASMID